MKHRIAWNRVAALKLRHFEVLLAISRHRSLTAVGDALEISQPAVSQLLADIESALGVELFERSRPLRPTTYAGVVIRHAQRVLNDAKRTHEELEAIRAGAVGRVRIGAMSAAITTLIPDAVLDLVRIAPRVSLLVVEDIWAGLWERFERSELDLLVGRPDSGIEGKGLSVERLYNDPHVVICGPNHPLAKSRRPTWAEASRFRMILPPPSTPLHEAIRATFAAAGLTVQSAGLESAAHGLNYELLRRSNLLAIAPQAAARLGQSRGLVCALRLPLLVDIGPLGMAWRTADVDHALLEVIEALRRQASLRKP